MYLNLCRGCKKQGRFIMIREICSKDKNQIFDLMKTEIKIDHEDFNFDIDHSNKIIAWENDESKILGFSTFRIWGKEKNKADVYTYVLPSERRKGIGTSLYREIIKNIDGLTLEFISSRVKADEENTVAFYQKLGYQTWYVELDLIYAGLKHPETNLNFVPYEDQYFEQYAQGLRTSFYELRVKNDFQPFFCCELDEEKRKEFLDNKDNLYLLFENEHLVSSVMVLDNGRIEDLFVTSLAQGNGYGKKTMQFAINKAIENECHPISLSAIEWNSRAVNLYLSLGFEITQTTRFERLYTGERFTE